MLCVSPPRTLNLLREIHVSALANHDFVLAGEKKNFFRSLEFAEIADVLAVDPNAGCFLDFGGADEIDLSEDAVPGTQSRNEA
jgi:hypothetical protein